MTHPPEPNDRCPCASGLRYGDCHQQINEAPPHEVLNVGRKLYAERWSGNAGAYEAQGLYGALAKHLASFVALSRVIDVGCGRGEGLAALRDEAASAQLLVGLDENPDCLKAAAQRLGVADPPERLRRIGGKGREHGLELIAERLTPLSPVFLAQTDLLRLDPELDTLIATAAPYDAVTLWFTGVHPARQFDEHVKALEITSDRVHRMAMDIATLELAGAVVRPGGCLHVVTRGVSSHAPSLKGQMEEEMRALATHGPADLVELRLVPYQEPASSARIGVAGEGFSAEDGDTFACSAILRIET